MLLLYPNNVKLVSYVLLLSRVDHFLVRSWVWKGLLSMLKDKKGPSHLLARISLEVIKEKHKTKLLRLRWIQYTKKWFGRWDALQSPNISSKGLVYLTQKRDVVFINFLAYSNHKFRAFTTWTFPRVTFMHLFCK